MPLQTPKEPSNVVKTLAVHIGHCIDLFQEHAAPVTPNDILQALEWVRFQYTEALIKKHLDRQRKPKEPT